MSGASRRGRRDLLKTAETQRKQRQEHNRREKAARRIQRETRGYLSRLHTLSTKIALPYSSTNIAALSMCLLYHKYLLSSPRFDHNTRTTRKELLLKFEKESNNDNNNNNSSTNSMLQPMEEEDGTSDTNNNQPALYNQQLNKDTSWFSRRRLVQNTLQELNPLEGRNTTSSTSEEDEQTTTTGTEMFV